ncbi:LacI family DNA-binding transcriptional regulator [Microlunatus flavus]|uniref:DNA-binding transcriptional regulator, LacI/PurR family n=1 Tax=Microlunatus flavus TaxID=1036181 RepID=A0A1H9N590_9ACTN|nr:LacI family DNA-binding transcriptional regulator [Microlunatus flavus]SER30839.1 DNA-binding transcriptional regulator, LacI/PurR family [Microlunatus flavus]
MARVTLKTVATAVGVSPATVSNAYNRPDQLSAELRERILAVAAELGFTGPDAAGRALRTGRSGAVGVLLTGHLSYAFSDPYAVALLAGLASTVERTTSIVLLPLPHDEDGEPDLSVVRSASIDALALLSLPASHPAAALARARGISLVTTDRVDDPDASWVAIDDRRTGTLVGEHLAGLGHTDVLVVAPTDEGPSATEVTLVDPPRIDYADYSARLAGLSDALGGRITMVTAGVNDFASGQQVAAWLLGRDALPTAVVGLSDVLALGVLEGLAAAGVDVPGSVSVCGFDDIAAAAPRGLTTVRQPITERGREIGRMLLDPLEPPRQVLMDVELVVRTSSGPARSAR